MCGIVAVLRRPARRASPGTAELCDALAGIGATLGAAVDDLGRGPATCGAAAEALEGVDRLLRGTPGVRALLADPKLPGRLRSLLVPVEEAVARLESALDATHLDLGTAEVEAFNAALVRLKDAAWAVRVDRLGTAEAVGALAGDGGPGALDGYLSLQVALASLGRLEVRGRDSAGIHVLVDGHGLDLADPGLRRRCGHRLGDPLFTSLAVRTPGGRLSIAYKVAAEIGELGDNIEALRTAIAGDELLRLALAAPTARATVLGHTRWASVGIISPANAHPLNGEEDGVAFDPAAPYVVGALNGDVDNYAALRAAEGLAIPAAITTDAKVIPVLVARRLREGMSLDEAFAAAARSFEGSVAIAAQCAAEPRRLLLGQRGSGQGLYVGVAEDAFVVASEPYGLVEETAHYLRMDGESGGQLVALDVDRAGELAGIERRSYTGRALPVGEGELTRAEITTRDIDRRGYRHFLLKEISESPQSVRKTLRGRIQERDGLLRVELGEEALPASVRSRLASGEVRRILVIGQGTAAVAAQAVAAAVARAFADRSTIVEALPATELSGFSLDDDMADTLVVAVSQSGTTTDTNRTVDLARGRGASVLAIVNRRNSDLVSKADGVLYTSDGRDVEMSVASTKAFYAQVAAGTLLALALAEAAGRARPRAAHELLAGLRALPAALERVLAGGDRVADAAAAEAPTRRYWAVVGSGANRVAAAEVRIKLSELCYKSIACDATEDKKHIDLSAEPLILVCAAGLTGPNADDAAKEVAIYRAHKAAPIVIADEGDDRFTAALHILPVPVVHPDLAFVLSAMVGHLFGYHAALAVDAGARPLREARARVEQTAEADPSSDGVLERLAETLAGPAAQFFAGLREGRYNGHLEASTAVRVASLLHYASGTFPLDAYEVEFGRTASPGALLHDLADALTRAIDELSRPIDAIKHQAKTVTVGISRSEDALLRVPLVKAVLDAAPTHDRLSYKVLRSLAALDPAVASVDGYTRYRVDGAVGEKATIHVVEQGGVAADLPPSRTLRDPTLRGTKRGSLDEREVTVAVGRSDGRTVVLVPEASGHRPTGLTLLHVTFHPRLPAEVAARVLAGYRQRRFDALVDAVTETEDEFRDSVLGDLSVVDLLVTPVLELADRWRTTS